VQIARPVAKLIESFEKLPGIGPKTAQRLTYYLLHVPQEHLEDFGQALLNLKKQTVLCSQCLNVSEKDPCAICADPTRDRSAVCVVEQPLDVLALEKAGVFRGVYQVLHGAISPLNNIGPDEIHIGELMARLKAANSEQGVKEVILALNPNMEGEATAMYIQSQIASLKSVLSTMPRITRLARGLPVGADIEYADEVTLTRAMEGRSEY